MVHGTSVSLLLSRLACSFVLSERKRNNATGSEERRDAAVGGSWLLSAQMEPDRGHCTSSLGSGRFVGDVILLAWHWISGHAADGRSTLYVILYKHIHLLLGIIVLRGEPSGFRRLESASRYPLPSPFSCLKNTFLGCGGCRKINAFCSQVAGAQVTTHS